LPSTSQIAEVAATTSSRPPGFAEVVDIAKIPHFTVG